MHWHIPQVHSWSCTDTIKLWHATSHSHVLQRSVAEGGKAIGLADPHKPTSSRFTDGGWIEKAFTVCKLARLTSRSIFQWEANTDTAERSCGIYSKSCASDWKLRTCTTRMASGQRKYIEQWQERPLKLGDMQSPDALTPDDCSV